MNADAYINLIGTIAKALVSATGVAKESAPWTRLAWEFVTLGVPLAEMISTGRDPTPAERQALVDYRHKLSAELQKINTSEQG